MQLLKKISIGWITTILWLISVAMAIADVLFIRDIVLTIHALIASRTGPIQPQYGQTYWTSVTVGNFSVLILAILCVVFVVATGEYHYRHAGERGSWKLFGWTFGVQAAILIIRYFS